MNLYSRKKFLASAVLVLACALFTTAVAQKRKSHKLRATALVEFTTDASGKTATRIIPITVLDDGQFQDASTYKARPRPMALEEGIVYEAQASGTPVATATVLNGSNSNGWMALARWKVITEPVKKPDTPVTVSDRNDNSGRPVLHRAANSASDAGAPSPAATPAPGSNSGSSSDDRPVLRRPNDSGSSSTSSTSAPTNSPSPTPASGGSSSSGSGASNSGSANGSANRGTDNGGTDNDRPTLHRPADSTDAPSPTPSAASASATQSSSSASEDPDRPTLRHQTSDSKSEQTQPTQVEDGTRPTAASSAATKKSTPPPVVTKSYVAVSDTQSLDTRSFDFKWKLDEAADMEAKMRKLALAQVPKQLGPQQTKAEVQLKNVAIRSFDLDLSNDAVIVLSAEIPATVPSTKESAARFVSRYITLVARVDFDGEPQKVLANVTDSTRLDVTPRLELIDAVDVDGDGVAELLFREYGFNDTSFVVYSIGRSTANKLFEGASRGH